MESQTNKIKKTFRIEKSLNEKLVKQCENQIIKQIDFVEQAILEKLNRRSIEENLSIRIDSTEVVKILAEYIELFEKKITYLEDIVRSLSAGINTQFEKIEHMIQLLSTQLLIQNVSVEIPKNDTLKNIEEKLLGLLPSQYDELCFEFNDIDMVNRLLEKLKKEKRIFIRDGFVTKNE